MKMLPVALCMQVLGVAKGLSHVIRFRSMAISSGNASEAKEVLILTPTLAQTFFCH